MFLASFTLADKSGNIICDSRRINSGTGYEKAFIHPEVDGFQDVWHGLMRSHLSIISSSSVRSSQKFQQSHIAGFQCHAVQNRLK